MTTMIGIDVSKKTATVAVVTDLAVVTECHITLDLLGFNQVKNLYGQYQIATVIFESTGIYSRRLEAYLVQNSLRYHILNPLVAKKRLDNGTRLRKNDQADARKLAQSEMMTKNIVISQPKVPVYSELADMSRFYDQLNEDKKRTRNRIHRLVQLTFATYTDEFDISTANALSILKHYPSSAMITMRDINELVSDMKNWNLRGLGDFRANQYARRLWRAAGRNQMAVSASSHNVYQLQYQIEQLEQLIQEQKQLILAMVKLAEELPEYQIIQSIPGIAESTIVRLIGELGDLRRFETSQQINSYIGIDLTEIDSGDYQSARHITKHGDPHARRILYWTIINQVSSSMTNNHIRDLYYKKRQSTSSKKKLIVCLMDHLIRTIFHLVKTNQVYSYEIAVSG
ncbi:MAG: IS110 family transposase [Liquorilactobacillus ghanensis]|uniref:IS110 family transposase n=1 Tax=Liquorilactobacillus ghanensis TaxID=399370 RepID=UPI0039E8ABD0